MEMISPESVEVKLENKDLWDKFNTLGTEMVITKTGRRMFPSLEVSIQGLLPDETYMVILDITKVDDRRYKFNEKENHWKFVETRVLSPSPVGMFVHTLCPCSGSEICVQPLSFNKVKLTNNPHTVSFGHILLESMCRYVPRLSIVTYHDYHNQRWENGVAFRFKETEFIAVTAYMNKDITKLKIDNNPFARAFRENGLKGKGLQNISTSSDVNSIDFEKDQAAEESNEAETPMAITYLNDEESDDRIRVLHVSPSSIIVTDVLPSFPSTSSLMATTNLLSSKMSTTCEVNVVFETTSNAAKANEDIVSQTTSSYEAEKNGLDSLLYPTTPLQSITVKKSGFITGEKSGNKARSSHEGIIEADDEGDFLCKVIDVRSIRETPPLDEQVNKTRMRPSLECEENKEFLYKGNDRGYSRDKCERIEAGTTTKYEENENCLAKGGKLVNKDMKCCDKYETFDGENENHLDEMRNGGCWNDESSSENPSELTRKTIDNQDICKDTNVSPKKQKLVNDNTGKLTHLNGVISTCNKRITRDNAECDNLGEEVEETKLQDSGDSWSEKTQDQQRRVQKEDNSSQGNVDSDCVKESTLNEKFPIEETTKPQISKLLNFVNSVSMPGVLNFGTEKKTLTSHQDSNNKSLLKESPEILLGQKRSVEGRPAVEPKKARLLEHTNEGLKSCDQSSNVLSSADQSKDPPETLNQLEKRFESVHQSEGMVKSLSRPQEATKPTNPPNNPADCQNQKLKSSMSNFTPLQVHIKKEFCNENSPFIQEQRTNKPEEKTAKGIPTTVINVGHEERTKSLVSNGLRRRDSLYRTKYPEQWQGKARGSGSQGLNQVNSTRSNEHPSCLEGSRGIRQEIGNQNGVQVESASTKSFPVILSSYSIPPSKFSKQQNIDLNNETRVDVLNYENRVPVVYPAENFYVKKSQGKEVVEKCSSNKTETRCCQPKLGDGKKEACAYPTKSNLNYRKIFPKPVPHESHYNLSKQKEFIDLNSSMSANLYQRQSENLDHNYLASKGVPLQVLYTFETKMSLSRAPDPRLPEVYNPTKTTFTGYASNLICSTLPIATANKGFQPAAPGKYY